MAAADRDRRVRQEERRARRAAVTDPDTVMAAGAALLATRSRTTRELRGRLVALGYASGLVDQTIERLVALGYLDDAEYARAWIAGRDRSRPRGSAALRRELLLKGLDRDLVEAALGERDQAADPVGHEDWHAAGASRSAGPDAGSRDGTADLAAALRLLERRRAQLAREPDPRRARQRAYALLARNGFDPSVCTEATRAFLRASDDDWAEQV